MTEELGELQEILMTAEDIATFNIECDTCGEVAVTMSLGEMFMKTVPGEGIPIVCSKCGKDSGRKLWMQDQTEPS